MLCFLHTSAKNPHYKKFPCRLFHDRDLLYSLHYFSRITVYPFSRSCVLTLQPLFSPKRDTLFREVAVSTSTSTLPDSSPASAFFVISTGCGHDKPDAFTVITPLILNYAPFSLNITPTHTQNTSPIIVTCAPYAPMPAPLDAAEKLCATAAPAIMPITKIPASESPSPAMMS